MLFAFLFVSLRLFEIVTLTPIVGMLGYFVRNYDKQGALTPDSILILFIVSVLALTWAVGTLFAYHRSSANARFIALVDMGIFGALVAGIYFLRGIANADCTDVSDQSRDWTVHIGDLQVSGPGIRWHTDKPCAMLKASWAFAIINCIVFVGTAGVAFMHGDSMSAHDERSTRHHHSRREHRSHSGSRHSRSSYSDRRRVYV